MSCCLIIPPSLPLLLLMFTLLSSLCYMPFPFPFCFCLFVLYFYSFLEKYFLSENFILAFFIDIISPPHSLFPQTPQVTLYSRKLSVKFDFSFLIIIAVWVCVHAQVHVHTQFIKSIKCCISVHMFRVDHLVRDNLSGGLSLGKNSYQLSVAHHLELEPFIFSSPMPACWLSLSLCVFYLDNCIVEISHIELSCYA